MHDNPYRSPDARSSPRTREGNWGTSGGPRQRLVAGVVWGVLALATAAAASGVVMVLAVASAHAGLFPAEPFLGFFERMLTVVVAVCAMSAGYGGFWGLIVGAVLGLTLPRGASQRQGLVSRAAVLVMASVGTLSSGVLGGVLGGPHEPWGVAIVGAASAVAALLWGGAVGWLVKRLGYASGTEEKTPS